MAVGHSSGWKKMGADWLQIIDFEAAPWPFESNCPHEGLRSCERALSQQQTKWPRCGPRGPFSGASLEEPHKIDDDILKPFQTSRAMINLDTRTTQPATGELPCTMIMTKLPTLLAIDETTLLELAIAENLSSGPGAEKLHGLTLASLPSRTYRTTNGGVNRRNRGSGSIPFV